MTSWIQKSYLLTTKNMSCVKKTVFLSGYYDVEMCKWVILSCPYTVVWFHLFGVASGIFLFNPTFSRRSLLLLLSLPPGSPGPLGEEGRVSGEECPSDLCSSANRASVNNRWSASSVSGIWALWASSWGHYTWTSARGPFLILSNQKVCENIKEARTAQLSDWGFIRRRANLAFNGRLKMSSTRGC